jgi:hypothetical protein
MHFELLFVGRNNIPEEQATFVEVTLATISKYASATPFAGSSVHPSSRTGK